MKFHIDEVSFCATRKDSHDFSDEIPSLIHFIPRVLPKRAISVLLAIVNRQKKMAAVEEGMKAMNIDEKPAQKQQGNSKKEKKNKEKNKDDGGTSGYPVEVKSLALACTFFTPLSFLLCSCLTLMPRTKFITNF